MIPQALTIAAAAVVLGVTACTGSTERVRVVELTPSLWRVVGDGRTLIRAEDGLFVSWCDPLPALSPFGRSVLADGVARDKASRRFVSLRDDVDMTYAPTCPL